MVAEIVGGWLFGSIALIADGLHMSTHAGALLLAALAYTYARRYANDPRFTFGTGKLGDLAGFTSAIILAMIALLIAYEAISRLFTPVPIYFAEAIPVACLGLAVNIASAWLLSGGDHHGHSHGHSHGHGPAHAEHGHDELNASPPNTATRSWKYSRTACRRASGFMSNPDLRSRRRPRRSKPSALTARGKSSPSWIRAAFWNPSRKSRSRTPSRQRQNQRRDLSRRFRGARTRAWCVGSR